MKFLTLLIIFIFFYSCAGITYIAPEQARENGPEKSPGYKIIDVSTGLPRDGLWRQNIILFDMNGDGLLDIIAPPPRKAEAAMRRPFIFINDKDKWIEGAYKFPDLKEYDYGGIAVGDINKDGHPDIVLACHEKRIIILKNNGKGAFEEADFPAKDFKSRTIGIADINNDGYLDIVALSEFPSPSKGKNKGESSQIQGILIGINKQGQGFDINIIKEGTQFFGDSLSLADINNDGNMDIVIAVATAIKAYKKIIWLGDGKGGFKHYDNDFTGDLVVTDVRAGDIDGDGVDEVILKLSGRGNEAGILIAVFKLIGEGMIDITHNLKPEAKPLVFDLADIDGDHRKELILLSEDGLHIYKYLGNGWSEIARYQIPYADTIGAYDIKAGRQADGSWLIVYNLGSEVTGNRGIRAFLLRGQK